MQKTREIDGWGGVQLGQSGLKNVIVAFSEAFRMGVTLLGTCFFYSWWTANAASPSCSFCYLLRSTVISFLCFTQLGRRAYKKLVGFFFIHREHLMNPGYKHGF